MVHVPQRRTPDGARDHSPLIRPESVRQHTLANGLTVLVRRDASAPVVAIVTYVSAGYFDETDDVIGIAHVLEHMYFKGTTSRGVGEIAKHTKGLGGYLNAATIYDHTSYYTVLPSSAFAEGLAIQADAYANSLLDSDELRRELEVIIEEAKRKADNPSAVATETLYELLHDRHRIRRWRIGREAGLRTFTAEAVKKFYRAFYHPANTVLTVVGDIDPDRVIAEAEARYGPLATGSVQRSRGPQEDGRVGFRYREMTGDVLQTQIAFGWRAPGTLHPDAPALDLLSGVLSSGRASRLYRAVRDRKLASSIGAYHYTPTDLGVFVVHGETRPETSAEAMKTVWDQLRRVRDGDISGHEVERTKRIYESRWIRQLEDMEGQANYLAAWQAHGDWTIGERYLERVMTRSPADLANVANQWLSPDDVGVLIYRPISAPSLGADGDAMRQMLGSAGATGVEPSKPFEPAPPIAPARSKRKGTTAGVNIYRAPGGIPVLVRLKPESLLTHIGVFVVGGASEEPETLAGLTLLMARTAGRGSERRNALQIAEESEMLGGSISASVSSDSFGWTISVPSIHTLAAIELLADVVQHPSFPPDVLETERAAAIASVVSTRDDMHRYPMRLAISAAFAGHEYGVPATGTEESLGRITCEDVARWHHDKALRGATVIAVVGDGDADSLAALAAGAFASLTLVDPPRIRPPSWPTRAIEIIEPRVRAQSAVAMLFPGPSRVDDDRFAASLIGGIASGLGGRFFDELRERRSLCYTVQTFLSERWRAGSFVAYVATSPDKEIPAREALLEEFRKLREDGVTATELARVQTYAIGVHQIGRQGGGAVLGEVIDAWMFGDLTDLDDVETRIRAVTLADIQRVAKRYFDPAVRVEAVVRGGASVPGAVTP